MTSQVDLQRWFGSIDIYLFDQILNGRITVQKQVLDAGCGGGRNLIYFLNSGFDVCGADQSREAIAQVRALAAELAPQLPADNFRVEAVEKMSFPDASFDVVISSAVLHFASDEEHWQSMLNEMWRVLRPRGIFFARLASSIGIENQIRHLEGRRYQLPDGSDRFLVDERMLHSATEMLGAAWLEPLKTVVVQNMRSMSNWCLRKL
jgi:tellurite methyltransferase